MEPGRDWRTPGAERGYLAPLQEYKETALKLFPELDRRTLDECSISPADALFLGYFLEHGPDGATALEIGPDTGAAALCLVRHPRVSRVVNVNPNPPVTEELDARLEDRFGGDSGRLEDLGTMDVARAVVGECPEESEKAGFFEGGGLAEALESLSYTDGGGLVVLLEGMRSREEVERSLSTVFDSAPRAIVLVDGCRGSWGLFVQAGVAGFVERANDEYRFRPAGDLGPALAGANFGLLYPESAAAGVEKTLKAVGREFSLKLDPLRLLDREEELMNTVSKVNRQLTRVAGQNAQLERRVERIQNRIPRLEARIERLKSRNARLISQYSRIRYRAANTAAEGLLKLPGTKELLVRVARLSGRG